MRIIAKSSLLVLAAFAPLFVSCEGVERPEEEEVASDNPYNNTDTNFSFNEGEVAKITNSNEFTFKYFANVYSSIPHEGIITCPLGAQFICGMIGNQISNHSTLVQTLGINGDLNDVNSYFNKLINDIAKIGGDTRVIIANALMKDVKGPDFPEEFLGVLKNNYLVDYSEFEAKSLEDQPIEERPENIWVKEKTSGLIDEAPEPILPEMASLFNVSCFSGAWLYNFNRSQTKERPFYGSTGTKKVPMMSNLGSFPFYKEELFSAVALPFENTSFLFTILLPNEGKTLESVIKGMRSWTWDKIRQHLSLKTVSLSVPRCSIYFDDNALFFCEDFTASYFNQMESMAKEGLAVRPFTEIRQKAFMEIKESGVSAANTNTSLPPDNIDSEQIETFNANHPFAFIISDAGSGLVLFIGKYGGD